MRQTYFNSNCDEDSDEYESISNKNYHVINELSEGKYFGEISLLNGTHTTASIHCVSDVICAKINKASFFQFLGDFKGCEVLIRTKLYEYNDIFFTKMHRIIKNAKWFSSLESQSVRRILYMLQRRIFQTGNHIVLSRQLADNFYFVISGTVGIYIEDFEAKTKTLFCKLKEGSSFNVCNCLLSHYSLFRYEAFTDCIIANCSFKEYYKGLKEDFHLKEILDKMKCEISCTGEKYDFGYCNTPWVNQKDDHIDKSILNSFHHLPDVSPNSSFRTSQIKRQKRTLEDDQNLIAEYRRKTMLKSQKIIRKIMKNKQVLIDGLKIAKLTFEIIDENYNKRVKINAQLLSNKIHLEETKMDIKIKQFQDFIEETKADLGPLSKLEMKSEKRASLKILDSFVSHTTNNDIDQIKRKLNKKFNDKNVQTLEKFNKFETKLRVCFDFLQNTANSLSENVVCLNKQICLETSGDEPTAEDNECVETYNQIENIIDQKSNRQISKPQLGDFLKNKKL